MPEAELKDVQGDSDPRGITVERAGIADLALPLLFIESDGGEISTQASASAWTEVPPRQRGAHMSRLVTALGGWREGISLEQMKGRLAELARLMEASKVGVSLAFTFFLERSAPVSDLPSWIDCKANLSGLVEGGDAKVSVTVEVPVTTLCPCSKEVSSAGAHSQRARLSVTVDVEDRPPVLRELAERLESHASARLDAVLKREDEKFVTESAYDRPRFAEDVVREVAADMAGDGSVRRWSVSVLNMESIHNHDVFATTSSAQT